MRNLQKYTCVIAKKKATNSSRESKTKNIRIFPCQGEAVSESWNICARMNSSLHFLIQEKGKTNWIIFSLFFYLSKQYPWTESKRSAMRPYLTKGWEDKERQRNSKFCVLLENGSKKCERQRKQCLRVWIYVCDGLEKEINGGEIVKWKTRCNQKKE